MLLTLPEDATDGPSPNPAARASPRADDTGAVVPRNKPTSSVTCTKLHLFPSLHRTCRLLSDSNQPHCMLRVRSGFGGFGTYWADALRAARASSRPPHVAYNSSRSSGSPVEHVGFNLALDTFLASDAAGAHAGRPLLLSTGFRPYYLYGSGKIWDRIRQGRRDPQPAPSALSSFEDRNENVKLSLVCVTRNDDWGALWAGGLVRRATLSLLRMLHVADEVILVDMNSPKNVTPLITQLPVAIRRSPRLRTLVIDAAACAELRRKAAAPSAQAQQGTAKAFDCGDRFYETLARNEGLRLARGAVIASTNIDVMPPARPVLTVLVDAILHRRDRAFVLERKESHVWRAQARPYLLRQGLSAQGLRHAGFEIDGASASRWKQGSLGGLAQLDWGFEAAFDPQARQPPLSWCPPTTFCHHSRFGARGPPRHEGYPLESIDDLHPNLVRHDGPKARTLSLETFAAQLPKSPTAALGAVSIIDNVGDFQLAHRALWAKAPFAVELSGRQYADSALIVAWLNCNATVALPTKVRACLYNLHALLCMSYASETRRPCSL